MTNFFWHNLTIEDTLKLLGSDFKKGLSAREVVGLQEKFGKNRISEERKQPQLRILLNQFNNPLIYILILSGFITLLLKDYSDSVVIFCAVILNTLLGFFQESKASRTLDELRKIIKKEAKVIREGGIKFIDSLNMVPGDIFILDPGDKVPADGRVIESHNLKMNEMILSGEWLPAKKKTGVLAKETRLADRDNMVYMGTIVEDGKGRVVATETGKETELGRLAEIIKETKEEETPLQKKFANLSKIIGFSVVCIAFLIFIEGLVTRNTFLEMFTTSVAIAVASIPEGLPMALTIILALGMRRILKRQGLVRKLLAAETLGGATVIAADKTCTLTQGKMRVEEVLAQDNKSSTRKLILKIAALCNEAYIENPRDVSDKWRIKGRPTDKALLEASLMAGILKEDILKKEEEIDEIPFDGVRKYAASLTLASVNKFNLYVLGAPEKMFSFSKMSDQEKESAKKTLRRLTENGQRVVAAAFKKISKFKPGSSVLEGEMKELDFLGFISLEDPLRPDARASLDACAKAGLRPLIITGDHKLTARSLALKMGYKVGEENILEGKDLELLSDKELEKKMDKIMIYARVEPKHKMRIVSAWQRMGAVVAMTGDGINDAPALKKADIGIALGSGTEVAKETADLVLLDDNFSIIVAAVEEGRAIMDNIRKVITYVLSNSFSEVILIGGALALGFPLPILPAQILWINLVEDGLPDTALAFEPKEDDLMKRRPAEKDVPLFTKEMKIIIFAIGIITDLMLLGLFLWLWKAGYDIAHIRTMIFSCLAIQSLFYVFSCKSLRKNIWQMNIFSNKFLVGAVLIGMLMLLSAVYLPPLQNLLRTVSLDQSDWLIVISMGIAELIFVEATKWFFISREKIKFNSQKS
ncbi:MAG: HAD-IC family P-type ATPase [Candidatus Pacebacteria bacterium]|nr:HAD-IC family P-type ATPase [Candidatus Paceibacterota bacterium]